LQHIGEHVAAGGIVPLLITMPLLIPLLITMPLLITVHLLIDGTIVNATTSATAAQAWI
jgi:hypothetical protein